MPPLYLRKGSFLSKKWGPPHLISCWSTGLGLHVKSQRSPRISTCRPGEIEKLLIIDTHGAEDLPHSGHIWQAPRPVVPGVGSLAGQSKIDGSYPSGEPRSGASGLPSGRGEFGSLPVGEAGQDIQQVVFDGKAESAAGLHHRKIGGTLGPACVPQS